MRTWRELWRGYAWVMLFGVFLFVLGLVMAFAEMDGPH